MPRPKRQRKVALPPVMKGFQPFGCSGDARAAVHLHHEEYEALRLADYSGLSQQEAAVRMDVSRPTFTRIYDAALKKIAQAFVETRAIVLEGGDFTYDHAWYRCKDCDSTFTAENPSDELVACPVCDSQQIDSIQGGLPISEDAPAPLPGKVSDTGYCICLSCGIKISHQAGVPCRNIHCPSCGKRMRRDHQGGSNREK